MWVGVWRPEDQKWCPRVEGRCSQGNGEYESTLLLCYIQSLNRWGSSHSHWWGQIFFAHSTKSNLFWKHPHRHTQKVFASHMDITQTSPLLNLTITCSEFILTTLDKTYNTECNGLWHRHSRHYQCYSKEMKQDEARQVCFVLEYNPWNEVIKSLYCIPFVSTHGDIIWNTRIWRTIKPYQGAVSVFAWVLTWMKKLFSFPLATSTQNLLASLHRG